MFFRRFCVVNDTVSDQYLWLQVVIDVSCEFVLEWWESESECVASPVLNFFLTLRVSIPARRVLFLSCFIFVTTAHGAINVKKIS